MSCLVRIFYDALPIAGTPSAGTTFLNQVYEIIVPNGDFIGEMIADGAGFSSCPSVTQYLFRARNPTTGQILGQVRSTTCHNLIFKNFQNTCPPSAIAHDCINGACFPASQFNTPGLYSSLSACEEACGTGCGGKCINNEDWGKIQSLVGKLKNRNCN